MQVFRPIEYLLERCGVESIEEIDEDWTSEELFFELFAPSIQKKLGKMARKSNEVGYELSAVVYYERGKQKVKFLIGDVAETQFIEHPNTIAFIHSHPGGDTYPTGSDEMGLEGDLDAFAYYSRGTQLVGTIIGERPSGLFEVRFFVYANGIALFQDLAEKDDWGP